MKTIDNRRRRVYPRGVPDLKNNAVHAFVPKSKDGCHEAKPLCGNGAFHLWWTDDPSFVNCAECIKLGGGL